MFKAKLFFNLMSNDKLLFQSLGKLKLLSTKFISVNRLVCNGSSAAIFSFIARTPIGL